MSSPINRIGSNTPYSGFAYQGNNLNPEPEKQEEKAEVKQEFRNISGDEMLSMMAQSSQYSTPVVKPNSVDIPKYVTADQAKDIAEFVTSFEDIVADNLKVIMQEFPNLSEDAQMALALEMFELE